MSRTGILWQTICSVVPPVGGQGDCREREFDGAGATDAAQKLGGAAASQARRPAAASAGVLVMPVLLAISVSHMLNDMIQSLIPAIYPILKESYALDFGQIGLITLAFQLTASLLQPVVGLYTDHRPQPYSLAVGMGFTLTGLMLLLAASSFTPSCCGGGAGRRRLVGLPSREPRAWRGWLRADGTALRSRCSRSAAMRARRSGRCWRPSSSCRAARAASPGSRSWRCWHRHALAASGAGTAAHRRAQSRASRRRVRPMPVTLPRARCVLAIAVLMVLIFSKFFYMASLGSYYTFYLIEQFGVSVQSAQLYLFVFLGGGGGRHLHRRADRRPVRPQAVIWVSILGVAALHAGAAVCDLFWTAVLSVIIGSILASAFSAIIVYAQELVPGRSA